MIKPDSSLQGGPARGGQHGVVLILEADRPIRALLAEWLEMAGYVSVGVHDVAAAPRATARYDLILVDIPAPLRSAQELIAALAAAEPGTPIIAMSADALSGGTPSAAAVARQLGVAAVLGKPFGREALVKAMDGVRKT